MITRVVYGGLFRLLPRIARRLPASLGQAVMVVNTEIITLRCHRAGRRALHRYAGATGLRLHLGCGDTRKPGFINIDRWTGDVTLDLREPLPFADGSCAVVYSEHFLEHVEYPDATLRLLGECRRVLQPGGVLDVGVPDTEWPLLEYAGVSRAGYFDLAKTQWHPAWCQTRLEHLNYHFRQGTEHRFAYDYETLERVLRLAGFVNIRQRKFRAETDAAHRELGTLYVEAERPR